MRMIPPAPLQFDGSIDELFERYVASVAPSKAAVERFHASLLKYLASPDPAFIIRGSSDHRRQELRTKNNLRILPSDNAPAWWVHHHLWQGWTPTPAEFAAAIESCPRHFHDVSRRKENGISAAGWYVAHILPAKFANSHPDAWSRDDAVMRFIRNVHPANHFYVPGGAAVGEDRKVIAYAAQWAEQRYGKIWDIVTTLAGPHAKPYLNSLPHVTGREQISVRPKAKGENAPTIGESGIVEYRSTRLHFKANVIEQLGPDEPFRIVSDAGTFQFTRKQFEEVFANVLTSKSWTTGQRHYHYKEVPSRAEPYRVE